MEYLTFETRQAFRDWLSTHHDSDGVWLLFGKRGGPKTLSAAEALEEALCFGWIDGQMQKLDDTSYIKYFASRRSGSNWSEKNKKLTAELTARGIMTERGLTAIETAKANGTWDREKSAALDTPEHIEKLAALLAGCDPAAANFAAKSPSVQRTYSRMYFDAKSEAARDRRLEKIIERLNQNLNPM